MNDFFNVYYDQMIKCLNENLNRFEKELNHLNNLKMKQPAYIRYFDNEERLLVLKRHYISAYLEIIRPIERKKYLELEHDKISALLNSLQHARTHTNDDDYDNHKAHKALVTALIPDSIVEILGGYEKLLLLPAFNKDLFAKGTGDYIYFPITGMPAGENIALGYDACSRLVIALRLIKKIENNQDQEMVVCYHQRYTGDRCSWVRGQNHWGGATLWDLPECDPNRPPEEFHKLKTLIKGDSILWYGDEFRLAPSKEIALLQNEVKRLRQEVLMVQERFQDQSQKMLLQEENRKRGEIGALQERAHDKTGLIFKLFKIPLAESLVGEEIEKARGMLTA